MQEDLQHTSQIIQAFSNKACVYYTQVYADKLLEMLKDRLESDEHRDLSIALFHYRNGEQTAPAVIYDLCKKLKVKYESSRI